MSKNSHDKINANEPREFGLNKNGTYEYLKEFITGKNGQIIVQEVVPGSITITREEFRDAVERFKGDDISSLEFELFGE